MTELVNPALEAYATRHTTPLPPLLQALVAETEARKGRLAGMLSGALTGTLLQTLAWGVDARRSLEIGMFTDFSALLLAAALPDDGELITCDLDPEAIAIARTFFGRSPDGKKISVREGPALDTLKTLSGPFDLIFIAADKDNYEAAIVAFNEHVRTDPRVSHVLLAARDGVLLVRRR